MGRASERRRLERRLRELDRLDARFGLGAVPGTPRPPARRSRLAGPLAALITVVVVVTCAVLVGLAPVSLRDALGLGPHRLQQAPTVAGTGPYRFLQTRPQGDPVTWDPCRPVHFRVNPAGGPDDAVALVRAAVETVSAATGLRFEYGGTSTARPHWDTAYRPSLLRGADPVLVSWATSREVNQLEGRVAGVGGAVAAQDPQGVRRYVTGGVTLDRDAYDQLARTPGGRAQERAILLHELGHLVGLAHVQDPHQLMYPKAEQKGFGAGDLAGLARLGLGKCG